MSLLKAFLEDAIAGRIEPQAMDEAEVIVAVFALANQINDRHPGAAARHGWARLDNIQTFTEAVLGAMQALPPDDLR